MFGRATPTCKKGYEDQQQQFTLKDVAKDLQTLRVSLDEHVVGHKDVKEAMLLGLLAKEHVYLEGPPGVAKTMMSEIISESTGLEVFMYQMHRDTRLAELVGDSVIVRDRDEATGGEVIRQDIIPGGILTSEICVLDDISEALNVLLRILNERKFGSSKDKLPLYSAIASSNPATDDAYFAEPLDPANLDRFTLQVRANGLVQGDDWESAERVIDLYGLSQADVEDRRVRRIGRETLEEACKLVPCVVLGEPSKQVLLTFLRTLRSKYRLDESNSLLSDRTFLVKAVRVMKANAVLDGRDRCVPNDLRVLRFLTTFRVPENVQDKMDEIIDIVLRDCEESTPPSSPSPAQVPGDDSGDTSDENPKSSPDAKNPGASTKSPTAKEDRPPCEDPSGQNKSDASSEGGGPGAHKLKLEERASKGAEQAQWRPERKPAFDAGLGTYNIEPIMRSLRGNIDRGAANEETHPGGAPRGWTSGERLSSMTDADGTDLARWFDSPSPHLPRAQRRTRIGAGGRLVILRDTSASMEGIWADWCSLVCSRVIELAQRKHMRVGYAEFDSDARAFGSKGKFFTREYEALLQRSGEVSCSGMTNYEAAFDMALEEFSRAGIMKRRSQMTSSGRARSCDQHILFITDGEPTLGDLSLERQIRAAVNAGIATHTVFIGYERCPEVLDRISNQTGGSRFAAFFDISCAGIKVVDRRVVDEDERFFDITGPEATKMALLNRLSQVPELFRGYAKKYYPQTA
ncbi:MoxR-like AAA family ATPase [Hondaea fermentalgiana]|uniref:MoxR-like AAA family ATPase n=1 Tax=Hondaea fermentalgiana TaxID=2315210 RepID=A0A2R5GH78_9STRA|nr:MoxR-like AAA family ATPase [Hondaea fermentalgiana]|eukprot:GBG30266.1 MoxR-like AAA family ATPase [Hondaea fermentalgiana]